VVVHEAAAADAANKPSSPQRPAPTSAGLSHVF
jgi:hypothetical protein